MWLECGWKNSCTGDESRVISQIWEQKYALVRYVFSKRCIVGDKAPKRKLVIEGFQRIEFHQLNNYI